jgi:hypothetical protein
VQERRFDVEWKEIATRNRYPAARCVQSTTYPALADHIAAILRSDGIPAGPTTREPPTHTSQEPGVSARKLVVTV